MKTNNLTYKKSREISCQKVLGAFAIGIFVPFAVRYCEHKKHLCGFSEPHHTPRYSGKKSASAICLYFFGFCKRLQKSGNTAPLNDKGTVGRNRPTLLPISLYHRKRMLIALNLAANPAQSRAVLLSAHCLNTGSKVH